MARYPWLLATSAFAAGKAIPGVLTLVSIPVWLSQFGAANYALFSLYWTSSLIGTALAIGWLKQAILRHAGDEDMAYELLPRGTRWALEATPLAVVVPLGVLTSSMLDDDPNRWGFLTAAALGLLVNSRYVVRQTVIQRDAQATAYAVAETTRTAAALLFSILLAGCGVVTSWSLVVANTSATAMAFAVLGKSKTAREPASGASPVSGRVVLQFWKFGWPLSLWLAVSSSTMYIDRFLISSLYGLREAGDYAAAADVVVRGMGILVAPAIMFLHPTFMRTWNTGERVEALRAWRNMTFFLTLGTLLAAATVFVVYVGFSDALLTRPPSTATFGALVVGGAAWQLALMAHKPLEASNRTGVMLSALIVSLFTTVAVDLLLAPRLGVLGIAIGFAAGAATYIGLVVILNIRVVRIKAQLEVPA